MEHANQTQLLEWIPNISTGDEKLVHELEQIFSEIPQVYVLHVDRGPQVNRTVFTLAGTMNGLRSAVLELLQWSEEKIDMGLHKGTHPRLGALDVSPFVILQEENKENVLTWIRELAREMAHLFRIPIYLYEQSASHPGRINLAEIRRGEYEGLENKLKDPFWKPDFGESFHPRLGATVIGLRDFLIAYNVNLDTRDIHTARSIARQIRHQGMMERPHRLPGVKAIGWYLQGSGFCQVSTNITRSRETSPRDVYQRCSILAKEMGCQVTGSELIGLIPYHTVKNMLDQGYTTTTLARNLGLEYCGIQDLLPRIIEYKVYLASGKTIFNEIFESP